MATTETIEMIEARISGMADSSVAVAAFTAQLSGAREAAPATAHARRVAVLQALDALREVCGAELVSWFTGTGAAGGLRHQATAQASPPASSGAALRREIRRCARAAAAAEQPVRVPVSRSATNLADHAGVLRAFPVRGGAQMGVLVIHQHRIAALASDQAQCQRMLDQALSTLVPLLLPAPSMRRKRQPAHAHTHFEAYFAGREEAALAIDGALTITAANHAFRALTGLPESGVTGRRCDEVLRCRDTRGALLCGSARCPLARLHSDARSTPVGPMRWQTAEGGFVDVSASWAVERSTGQTASLVLARLAEPATTDTGGMLSMLSHELRTPLHTINGFLEIVLDGQVGALNERQHEFLTHAQTGAHQLSRLVEDILMLSRADAGQFELRIGNVAIDALARSAAQSVELLCAAQGITLTVTTPQHLPPIRGDELRLQQVLGNLLTNAVKFTPPHGTIGVRAERHGADIQVTVTDSGNGIAPADAERIFERFYQSEASTHQHAGGYGLGLAIARLIVEQHGGRIRAEPAPGHGAAITFVVPIA